MFISNSKIGKRAEVTQEARVYGGTFMPGTQVTITGESFYGGYEVRDAYGNTGTIDSEKLRIK